MRASSYSSRFHFFASRHLYSITFFNIYNISHPFIILFIPLFFIYHMIIALSSCCSIQWLIILRCFKMFLPSFALSHHSFLFKFYILLYYHFLILFLVLFVYLYMCARPVSQSLPLWWSIRAIASRDATCLPSGQLTHVPNVHSIIRPL